MINREKWTTQEIQFLRDNYHLGVKFIHKQLPNRTKYSIIRKAKKLSISSKTKKSNYDLLEISNLVKESLSFAEIFRKLNKSISGDSYSYLRRFIIKNKIDISHFQSWKNNGVFREKKNIQDYLINGSNISSSKLKDKLYSNGLKSRICEKCGQDEDWNGEKMSLVLDHINGISNDNRLENLQILCPNCNATLPTHCRGSKGLKRKEDSQIEKEPKIEKIKLIKENIKKEGFTESQKESQLKQRKSIRPSYEKLQEEISELGFVGTGKKYNVSDNSIRKWIKMYEKHGHNF